MRDYDKEIQNELLEAEPSPSTFEAEERHNTSNQNIDEEKLKRYTFLLGKSELFSSFIKFHNFPGLKERVYENFRANKKRENARRRKTEAEEDAEILNEVDEDKQVTIFTESPSYINGTMRDYQIHGLNWMVSLYENGLNGILADEMGLGKTLQVISLIGYLRHFRNKKGPHIVVVPKTTLHNWLSEFNRWCPEIDAFIFHGLKDDRPALINSRIKPCNFDVCITSYEMCLLEKSSLSKIPWEYMVIDEAHRIKNENSLLSKIIRIFKTKQRLLVTGTPLQNNLHELWALLNFLLPDVFGDSEQFENWFQNNDNDEESVIKQLHKILQPFLLRRIKMEVEKSLLPKKEINLYVGMSEMQRKWYRKLLEKDIEAVNGAVGKKEGNTRLLNIVMQLRKCCNHPYLFDGAEPGPPYTTDEHLVYNCGKMVVLDKLLKSLKAKGSRVLIFSQMSRMLDILEDYCTFREYDYCRIDGSTSHEDRISEIDEYNKPDSEKFVFLLTTRAGGLGINLVTADVVILFDSDWNPQVDLQAQDRVHRIGQTKQVYVFRMITENAIEEKVLEKATRKLRLDQLVIQQSRLAEQQKSATKGELLDMIQHGAEDVFKSTDSTMIDADIDEILKRGEEKTRELNEKYQQAGLGDLQNFHTEEGSTYVWEGEDYKNKHSKNIGKAWINPSKRERKVNYNLDSYYKEALSTTPKTLKPKTPRPPKQVQIHDFQFYPKQLYALYEKELLHYHRSISHKVSQPGSGEEESAEKAKEREERQFKIDNAEPLTEDEIKTKEALLAQGFGNWNRKDFRAFISAMEKYGRKNLKEICNEIEGKTSQEVKEYHKAFWQNYKDIADYEKIIDSIEKGEERIKRNAEISSTINAKVSQYSAPLLQLKVVYYGGHGRYTDEEDRFLIVMMDKYGHGNDNSYDRIRDEIRRTPQFRFNWFFKSRTPAEIGRRCATLINYLLKEASDPAYNDTNGKSSKRARIQ